MEVLLAGGSGFIGKALEKHFEEQNITTKVLTRRPRSPHHIHWDPQNQIINPKELSQITHIINLCGENIANKRWTNSRKKKLISSRVETTRFLYEICVEHCPHLTHYVGISGVNAFGFKDEKVYTESDPYGLDFLSNLVNQWESSHRLFHSLKSFSILRLGMVISRKGGAFTKIAQPMRWGLGAVPGSGNQIIPWIHLDDVVGLIQLIFNHGPLSLVHATAECSSMKAITYQIAKIENKKIILPNIPAVLIKLLLGELGQLLTESLRVSNEPLLTSGYNLKYKQPEDLINEEEN